MHTFICRQGLITYNWAVTEVASIQCGLMIFSTNMVTALTLSCMLSTQMDKIPYPPLWRHSWKTVQNKDIVARPKWKRREFPTICFQSQLSSIIFTGFMALWSLTKKNFFAIFWNSPCMKGLKLTVSKVGFEPTPTEVDCDLNAAP